MFREHEPGLNAMNTIINTALKSAMAAVHHLNDQGATVFSTEIRSGRPVITVDGPHGDFMRGALKSRRVGRDGVVRQVMVASVHGCQIEWIETHARSREALPA